MVPRETGTYATESLAMAYAVFIPFPLVPVAHAAPSCTDALSSNIWVAISTMLHLTHSLEHGATHAMMPTMAMTIPTTPKSLALFPLAIHPSATIKIVLTCPRTVLLTGPAPATMKNWEMLMRLASKPLCETSANRMVVSCFSYQQDHDPSSTSNVCQSWCLVRERYDVQQQKYTDWCLVEQQLHAVEFQFLLVSPNPYGVH